MKQRLAKALAVSLLGFSLLSDGSRLEDALKMSPATHSDCFGTEVLSPRMYFSQGFRSMYVSLRRASAHTFILMTTVAMALGQSAVGPAINLAPMQEITQNKLELMLASRTKMSQLHDAQTGDEQVMAQRAKKYFEKAKWKIPYDVFVFFTPSLSLLESDLSFRDPTQDYERKAEVQILFFKRGEKWQRGLALIVADAALEKETVVPFLNPQFSGGILGAASVSPGPRERILPHELSHLENIWAINDAIPLFVQHITAKMDRFNGDRSLLQNFATQEIANALMVQEELRAVGYDDKTQVHTLMLRWNESLTRLLEKIYPHVSIDKKSFRKWLENLLKNVLHPEKIKDSARWIPGGA